MSLGHALVGDHDEEIIMVALVKTTCMQVEIITNHPTKEFKKKNHDMIISCWEI